MAHDDYNGDQKDFTCWQATSKQEISQNMEEQLLLFGTISLDMIIGMALGMAASPLLMKTVKVLRQRRKMDRLLKEIAKKRMNGINDGDVMTEGMGS